MDKRLFLLDGMALAYRAHFAFIARPIRNSGGVNTSALFGFTNTILDLVERESPTHMAVVFDTDAPTERHRIFPAYKANRDEMPEDLSAALPHLGRFARAFGIPVVSLDGYEADDIIGTLAGVGDKQGYITFMVTPDKDYGQLVSETTRIYKPGTRGEPAEILGVPEVLERWKIERVDQVIDMLGLIGDSTDNIPGVPGVGPKTAQKLIAEFGSVDALLAKTDSVKGKLGPKLAEFAEQARLSRKLATINREVPIRVDLDSLALGKPDIEALRELMAEFEFRTLAKRALGAAADTISEIPAGQQGDLFADSSRGEDSTTPAADAQLDLQAPERHRTIQDTEHEYIQVTTTEAREGLAQKLRNCRSFCFDTETDGVEPRHASLVGIAICFEGQRAWFVRLPSDRSEAREAARPFRDAFEDPGIEKIGHNLKFDITALKQIGVEVAGPLFDTMLAHMLIDPDQRHSMDYLSEVFLDYSPIRLSQLIGDGKSGPQKKVSEIDPALLTEYSAEDADITWQLRSRLEPLLRERGQERVFREVEMPLIKPLVDMEHEGITLDTQALATLGTTLTEQAGLLEKQVFEYAGHPFNLNSPKQLGAVLFDELAIAEKPKKTRTGQYATNEQTLLALSTRHPIVQAILDYRENVKLRGTYVDALPNSVDPSTGRIHTHFGQLRTATGRLNSDNPNLQNIPVRSEQGREIRRAFVARGTEWQLLSADYSQIELRIIAALSQDPAMLEAFEQGRDIHATTAARVYGVSPDNVTREMRARAKMVNFGIPYGISAFGLSQRLGIARTEAAELIEGYFREFSGIRDFVDRTVAFCKQHGYVETVTGRRRYLPDINSANGTTRGAAERNAINTPIQGSAADMIKIAMARIHDALLAQNLRTRLLLQVHDELLFDLFREEESSVRSLVEHHMTDALSLGVRIVVDIGTGTNWLQAH